MGCLTFTVQYKYAPVVKQPTFCLNFMTEVEQGGLGYVKPSGKIDFLTLVIQQGVVSPWPKDKSKCLKQCLWDYCGKCPLDYMANWGPEILLSLHELTLHGNYQKCRVCKGSWAYLTTYSEGIQIKAWKVEWKESPCIWINNKWTHIQQPTTILIKNNILFQWSVCILRH